MRLIQRHPPPDWYASRPGFRARDPRPPRLTAVRRRGDDRRSSTWRLKDDPYSREAVARFRGSHSLALSPAHPHCHRLEVGGLAPLRGNGCVGRSDLSSISLLVLRSAGP